MAKFVLGFVDGNHADLPTLYVITICRTEILTQIADLNRLKNTLYLIPKVVWILVENKPEKSSKLATFIEESELESIHLNTNSNLEIDLMNTGLKWLRLNYKNLNGIVLFASSQGSYDIFRLYEHVKIYKWQFFSLTFRYLDYSNKKSVCVACWFCQKIFLPKTSLCQR